MTTAITILNETTVTPTEAATILRTTARSVRRWAEKGCAGPNDRVVRLEAVRVGTRWLTSREACERFVVATTAGPPPVVLPDRAKINREIQKFLNRKKSK